VTAYDLVVLGAGATGLGAGRTARAAGRTVALVEPGRAGGDCTHYGCVPSKSLLETARRVAAARTTDRGFTAQVEVDFAAVMAHVAATVAQIEQDESPVALCRQGIDLIAGGGRFLPRSGRSGTLAIDVDGRRVTARRVVVATGASATVPPIPGLDSTGYLTNETVFRLTEQPTHLLVLGGGPIGCELAQAFARLGSTVTIVEADRLLPRDEPEASKVVHAALERDGVTVRTGRTVVAAGPNASLRLDDGTEVHGSHVLVAVGRTPRTAALGLDEVRVRTDRRGLVLVDDRLRTTAGGIFAAGDCASAMQFTHVGYEQGRLAAQNAFSSARRPSFAGGLARWRDAVIPWVTFTDPEVGHVGLTEAEAYDRYGERALVAFVADSTSDRARCAGRTDGFVKLIAAPPPGPISVRPLLRLVGMTAVGPVGGELIAEGALGMRAGVLAGRIAQTIHAYPTWSLSTRYAAAQLFGAAGHPRPAQPAG